MEGEKPQSVGCCRINAVGCQVGVIGNSFSPETLTLGRTPNVLIKPTGSFILLTSYKLSACLADHLIFKKTEKITQGMISLDFFLTQQKAFASDIT